MLVEIDSMNTGHPGQIDVTKQHIELLNGIVCGYFITLHPKKGLRDATP